MRDCDQHNRPERKIRITWQRDILTWALVGAWGVFATAASAETTGERFRSMLKTMDVICANKKLPLTDTRCALPKLKAADPLATPEGRFAHSIKIPNPVPEDGRYRPGMTPEQFFDHLCRTEAGEFIYKTAENVEGVYQMRPRGPVTDLMLQHLYTIEDPYDYQEWEVRQPEKFFIRPSAYSYFEAPSEKPNPDEGMKEGQYRRYSGKNPDALRDMMVEIITERSDDVRSRYGYTWRGITQSHNRELGIVGGELIVLDLQTHDVLAVHRGFVRAVLDDRAPSGFRWANVCPNDKTRLLYTYEFISRVLKPLSTSARGGQNATK